MSKLNFATYLLCAILAALLVIIGTHAISFADDVDLKQIENEISVNVEDEGLSAVDYDRSAVAINQRNARTEVGTSASAGSAHAQAGFGSTASDDDSGAIVVKKRGFKDGRYHSDTVVVEKRGYAWMPASLGISIFGGVSKPIFANKFISTKPIVGIGLDVPLSNNIALEGNAFFARYNVNSIAYVYSTDTFWGAYSPSALYSQWGRVLELDSAREMDLGTMLRYEMFYDLPLTPFIAGGFGYHRIQYLGSLWENTPNSPNDSYTTTTWTMDAAAGLRLRLGRRLTLDGRVKYESAMNNRNRYMTTYVNGEQKANDRERFQIIGGLTFEM